MVVADGCTQHFILPVGVGTTVLQGYTVLGGIVTQVGSTGHIVLLQNVVDSYIAIVRYIGLLLSTFLGGDDDNTVGGFRTVDGGSGSIAQYVDALDIIRSNG